MVNAEYNPHIITIDRKKRSKAERERERLHGQQVKLTMEALWP